MGYERYARNARGGNDDRGQSNWRDGEPRGSDGWRGDDGYGSPDQSYGARQDYGNERSGYGQRQDYGRHDLYGQNDRGSSQRGDRGGSYGRQPQGYDNDRGFFERAGDEVRAWFGDDEANRRRDRDARQDELRYGAGSDDHYHNWRRGQIAALDRDYDEYRRENRTKFDTEFGGWRSQRQGQRDALSKVEEHMEVIGSDGGHVGTVDKVRGDRVILTKSDNAAGGHHHSIPSRWIRTVDDKVTIERTADEAHREWRDEERNRAFFNEDGAHRVSDDVNGPHVLGRSFSGTY